MTRQEFLALIPVACKELDCFFHIVNDRMLRFSPHEDEAATGKATGTYCPITLVTKHLHPDVECSPEDYEDAADLIGLGFLERDDIACAADYREFRGGRAPIYANMRRELLTAVGCS